MATTRTRRDSIVEAAVAELDAVTTPLTLTKSYPHESPPPTTTTTTTTFSDDNVRYLAYGSNLSSETFLGRRGIKPISQINVVVPTLRLVFDLPGLPYWEPRFANVARRDHDKNMPHEDLLATLSNGDYADGDPLIGVVYEVTAIDYGKIRATEGGYDSVEITCHTLPPSAPAQAKKDIDTENNDAQRPFPNTFTALTLIIPPEKVRNEHGQASLRYLNLIRTGAVEHSLPENYKSYLGQLQNYKRTSMKQTIGGFLLAFAWVPAIFSAITLRQLFSNKDGKAPQWVTNVMDFVFRGIWETYDHGWRAVWGEGEETVEKEKQALAVHHNGYGTV